MIPLLARCRAITENANAASLLYRIAYWMPKAKIVRDGLKWVANDAVEWCKQTGLSRDQYRRAIALLRAKGLVVTEQHLFRSRNVTHVRLTALAEGAIWDNPDDKGGFAKLGYGEDAEPEDSDSAQLHIQGESGKEIQKGESSLALANAHASGTFLKNKKITGGDKKANWALSTNSPKALSEFLNKLVEENYHEFVAPPSEKELGQYKLFAARCPNGDDPKAVIEACVTDWHFFCVEARSENCLFDSPTRPRIGFLLRCISTAVNFARSKDSAKEKASEVPKPPIGSAAPVPAPPEDPKATHEELMDILDPTGKWKKFKPH